MRVLLAAILTPLLLSANEVIWKDAVDIDAQTMQKAELEYVKEHKPEQFESYKARSTFVRSLEPQMVLIKPGSFLMGSKNGKEDERPVHKVKIGYRFHIGKYEVTVGEFRKFVERSGYVTDAEKQGGCIVHEFSWKKRRGTFWDNPGFPQKEDFPVVCVSYNDATAFVQWLSETTKKKYRLPSEAEWEYAARAGSKGRLSFGSDAKRMNDFAWFSKNASFTVHPVGTKRPNPWGLHDVHGNVWEWCSDWYAPSYRGTPTDGSANESGPRKKRVLRGGSWYVGPTSLRSTMREWQNPNVRASDYGFRIVRDIQ